MNIEERIYKEILNSIPNEPPEIGGILGSSKDTVCIYQLDRGVSKGCGCYYSPDVKVLNETIKEWQKCEIDFCGIFHTHYFGVKTLSDGDITYIKNIMYGMPGKVSKLYFPIAVMPDKELINYVALRRENTIEIKKEKIIIMRGERNYEQQN